MLSMFYCFAHPERGTAGALINGCSAGLAVAAVSLGVLTHRASLGISFSPGLFLLLLCPQLILSSFGT